MPLERCEQCKNKLVCKYKADMTSTLLRIKGLNLKPLPDNPVYVEVKCLWFEFVRTEG